MSKAIVPSRAAVHDTDDIADWLDVNVSPATASKFLDAIESAYILLGDHPAIGSTRHAGLLPDLPYPLRFHPVQEFPRILIYYMDRPDFVKIIRVWDAARGLQELIDTTE